MAIGWKFSYDQQQKRSVRISWGRQERDIRKEVLLSAQANRFICSATLLCFPCTADTATAPYATEHALGRPVKLPATGVEAGRPDETPVDRRRHQSTERKAGRPKTPRSPERGTGRLNSVPVALAQAARLSCAGSHTIIGSPWFNAPMQLDSLTKNSQIILSNWHHRLLFNSITVHNQT